MFGKKNRGGKRMSGKNVYTPELLAARAEIQDVMFRWCRAVDRRDWDAVREVFHPDGYDNHGIFRGNVDGLIAWLTERHSTIQSSMHYSTNMLIEFVDADNALAETYSMAMQRYPSAGAKTRQAITGGVDVGEQPFDMLMFGRYLDHYQRRNGEWRIFRRTVVFDNSRMMPVPEDGAKLNDDWSISARDGSDPLWAARKAFGLGPKTQLAPGKDAAGV
jgi:hypothetical protein